MWVAGEEGFPLGRVSNDIRGTLAGGKLLTEPAITIHNICEKSTIQV